MQAEPEVFAQTLVMTLVSGARSAGQRERCGQKNWKTPALSLSVVVHMCRYVDVLHTHTCAVTECSFVYTFGSSYRVPETNCVHPFTSSLFSQQEFLDIVGNGSPTGSVLKETIAVSATISISVEK